MLNSRSALLAELRNRHDLGEDCFGVEITPEDVRWASGERFDILPGRRREGASKLGLSPIEWQEQVSTLAPAPVRARAGGLKGYGELVREARRGQDITLDTLAKRMGLSVSYLSDIERGRRPPLATQATMELEVALSLLDHRLLDARAQHMERSTLPLGLRPDQDEAALHLGRVWQHLSPEAVKRVLEAAS